MGMGWDEVRALKWQGGWRLPSRWPSLGHRGQMVGKTAGASSFAGDARPSCEGAASGGLQRGESPGMKLRLNRHGLSRSYWLGHFWAAPRSEERRVGKECRSRWTSE